MCDGQNCVLIWWNLMVGCVSSLVRDILDVCQWCMVLYVFNPRKGGVKRQIHSSPVGVLKSTQANLFPYSGSNNFTFKIVFLGKMIWLWLSQFYTSHIKTEEFWKTHKKETNEYIVTLRNQNSNLNRRLLYNPMITLMVNKYPYIVKHVRPSIKLCLSSHWTHAS